MIDCPHCGASCRWVWGLGPRPSKRPVTICEACRGPLSPLDLPVDFDEGVTDDC